jgi:hypothetical protein
LEYYRNGNGYGHGTEYGYPLGNEIYRITQEDTWKNVVMKHPGEPKVSTTTPDALTSHRNDPSLQKMESQQSAC